MKSTQLYCVFLVLLMMASCEHDIELDLNQSKELVLLGAVNPQSPLEITLTTSSISSGDAVSYPSNAKILVFEEDQEIGEMEFVPAMATYTPKYKLDYKFKEGLEYSIIAEEDGFKTIKAKTVIPSNPPRTRVTLSSLNALGGNEKIILFSGKIQLEIIDALEDGELYHIKLSRDVIQLEGNNQDDLKRDTVRENLYFYDSTIADAREMTHEDGILITSESLKQNPDDLFFFFDFSFRRNELDRGKIYVELRKASKEYYNFHESVTDQDAKNLKNGLFSPKPNNIFNNIENGLGNFGSYNNKENGVEW